MPPTLPDRPDLEFLRRKARLLLRSARSGASEALARMRTVPRLSDLDEDELIAKARLVDAQHVIALAHGFASWSRLTAELEERRPVEEQVVRFLEAVRERRVSVARRLLAKTPGIARRSLHAACSLGAADIVESLLAADPSVALAPHPSEDWTPLVYACASPFRSLGETVGPGLLRCGELLLAHGADPNSSVPHAGAEAAGRISALCFACAAGDAPLARLLLEHGAEPNDGESVYHAAEGDQRECLELLLAHGADLDGKETACDKTPLYFLAGYRADHPAIQTVVRGAQWLLRHGADPNRPSLDVEETPLHRVAAGALDASAAELLLTHGADPDRPRSDGTTPYALAVRSGNAELTEVLRRHGAQACAVSPADELLGACMRADGEAACAVAAAHPGVIDRLTDEERMAPIQAAEKGLVDALRVMSAIGLDLTREGSWAGTPLHWAAWNGRAGAVSALIELGAPLDAPDREFGSSPLAWAAHGSIHCRSEDDAYCDVVQALLDAGATRRASINKWDEPPESMCTRAVAALLAKRGFIKETGDAGSA